MKPKVYHQVYLHIVFAVKFRDALLKKAFRSDIFKYMSGIVTQNEHKSININGVEDHVHILLGFNPSKTVSEIVFHLKRSSSLYINQQSYYPFKFKWQEGYGVFSYSRSQIEDIYSYIERQEEHHQKQTFRKEYIKTLEKYNCDYEERYLFDFFE